MNVSIPDLLLGWLEGGSNVAWCHNAKDLPGGDFCFYLSYGRIVGATTLSLYRHNLVVHASDLPKGRGWSPASWQILEGRDRILVTLLEAVGTVDAGRIYLQEWVDLSGIEIADDWRSLLARATINLSQAFVAQYPDILGEAREQEGEATSYARRRAKDSELDAHKTLAEQFNNLRIVDNEHYPAFFNYNGQQFILKIFKSENLY
jgi:methionyl-tRNA formyltransferase